jgi:hypothetical protein
VDWHNNWISKPYQVGKIPESHAGINMAGGKMWTLTPLSLMISVGTAQSPCFSEIQIRILSLLHMIGNGSFYQNIERLPPSYGLLCDYGSLCQQGSLLVKFTSNQLEQFGMRAKANMHMMTDARAVRSEATLVRSNDPVLLIHP